ncbi:MAG: 3-deoxy-7-phosphoheptulonate synthase [Verrucomicrobia bacterium]|nr:3-deoxy-7-phosphoheptulonate synthase [Verrucomicrobiota bacterium]
MSNLNIRHNVPLPAPALLAHEQALTEEQAEVVAKSRSALQAILEGEDERFVVVMGPCSIHDPVSGREYAERLAALREKVGDCLEVIMRVYFEKPRTTVGWKGLIMDPDMDGSANIPLGLRKARGFLQEVLDLGVPTATEFLDPITPQYIADLICWAAIGARTTESQTHRQMASGLSMPVGFKNTTNGGVKPAVNAVKAAIQPQTFLGVSPEGVASAVSTKGNIYSHLVLRGGDDGPNFSSEHAKRAAQEMLDAGLKPWVMIDASHANCSKDPERMPAVFEEIVQQWVGGDRNVFGAMLESNLLGGNQPIPQNPSELVYGQSITDPCIDWETSEQLILATAERLRNR